MGLANNIDDLCFSVADRRLLDIREYILERVILMQAGNVPATRLAPMVADHVGTFSQRPNE
jgi:hypothetical protein